MCGRGHAWQGPCVVGGVHGRGACVAGGHAWQVAYMAGYMHGEGGMCGRGHMWQGACVEGACVAESIHDMAF